MLPELIAIPVGSAAVVYALNTLSDRRVDGPQRRFAVVVLVTGALFALAPVLGGGPLLAALQVVGTVLSAVLWRRRGAPSGR